MIGAVIIVHPEQQWLIVIPFILEMKILEGIDSDRANEIEKFQKHAKPKWLNHFPFV